MIKERIQRIQQRVGATPDGFWGPRSEAACREHLRKLMPQPSPFPRFTQRDMTAFYGDLDSVERNLVRVRIPWECYLYGLADKPVTHVTVHVKCSGSLERVFQRIRALYPTQAQIADAGLDCFFGGYARRLVRGATVWSTHAWGAAVDFDADRNGLWTHWPTAATMPIEVMECFAAEGWVPAGAFWSRDAMHFQATAL